MVPFDAMDRFRPRECGSLLEFDPAEIRLHARSGFHGSLANVDVSGDPSIDHINIDKSPRLHTRAISEVLAVIKGHRVATPSGPNPSVANPPPSAREDRRARIPPDGSDVAKHQGIPAPPQKSSNGATNSAKSVNPKHATRRKAVHPAELPN